MKLRLLAFIRQRDFNRPSEEIALDLIWIHNQYRVPKEKIKFFVPMELDQRPEITDDPNTFVPVAIDDQFDDRFSGDGENGFMYRRLPLEMGITPNGPQIHPPQFPFRTYEVLDQINQQLNLQLTEQDVLDIEYTEGMDKYELFVNPHSLVWVGSTIIDVGEAGPGESLVTVTDLSGFNQYVP